ncbi:Glucosaminyl phosphatidylinositol (GlcN-PI) nositol acylation protein [Entophlyctis sp. JEL0112]|nr:Glucosaminyl phosphatidylinositol (GlcN-PI) nositol acylation protein [Entophlyctis sp. JEL0112]
MQTIAPQLHFGFAGALILGTYEYALQNYGLQDYILTAERHGYWSVFCIAAYLGEKVFGTAEKKGLKTLKRGAAAGSSGRFSLELLNAADLAGFVLPVATMFVLMHSDLGWRVSRRLANAPYCLWVLCVGAAFVAACLCVDWASGSVTYLRAAPDARRRQDAAALRAEKPAVRPPVWQYAQVVPTPYIFECVNRNQLAVFLLANVLTGIINLSIDTLSIPDGLAVLILAGYLLLVVCAAVAWDVMDWTLNLNSLARFSQRRLVAKK